MSNKAETFKAIDGIVLNLEFKDIFEMESIERLQKLFSDSFGISSLITDVHGKHITKTYNYCSLCSDIIRKTGKGIHDCGVMEKILSESHKDEPLFRECNNSGLWEAGIAIIVGNKHIGNWIIGQVQIDYKYDSQIRTVTNNLGVNQEEFTIALYDVPLMQMDKFRNIANMLHFFLKEISDKAYQNLQLKQYISDKEDLN